ncbi:MAG: M1 family aminopeptidase, partial [Verrucomicrobiota bacterium]
KPIFIVTPDEAAAKEKKKKSDTRTWIFEAENVRDFAWASSRKFIWDAMQHPVGDERVWAMSYYPNEAEPLWSLYSTQSVVHTLDVFSRFAFDYPYPVAISVNGPAYGMEYPMICFNGPRPEEDGTYTERAKYGLISVVIHEVGHNYFPMIVNSDERQWTWMDEGINTFLQFIAEQEWEEKYPSRRGHARDIVPFMSSRSQVPIMTNSESLLQFGNNAYAKPAAALNILRETVMGREVFDFAFRRYSQEWMFKRPMPADFFRIMEDASGIDLDWFWRGWFYTTDEVDVAVTGVRLFHLDSRDPDIEKPRKKKLRDEAPDEITEERNRNIEKRAERFP